jgi:hypothetical protein
MGADFWELGAWWAEQVAAKWEKTVQASVTSVKEEAERQAVKRRTTAQATKTASKRAGHFIQQDWRGSPALAPRSGRSLSR